MSKKPYYITTAIAYTSGKPHIGNTYEIVLADAIARFKRKEGYDVRFQTGTDEHGQKIELKAAEAGISPKEFVDNTAGEIKRIWDLMNTSYDKFIRTTDEDHEKQVQKIFKKLYDKGDKSSSSLHDSSRFCFRTYAGIIMTFSFCSPLTVNAVFDIQCQGLFGNSFSDRHFFHLLCLKISLRYHRALPRITYPPGFRTLSSGRSGRYHRSQRSCGSPLCGP